MLSSFASSVGAKVEEPLEAMEPKAKLAAGGEGGKNSLGHPKQRHVI
jgi:hypothetical protein